MVNFHVVYTFHRFDIDQTTNFLITQPAGAALSLQTIDTFRRFDANQWKGPQISFTPHAAQTAKRPLKQTGLTHKKKFKYFFPMKQRIHKYQ